ncbi:unnamed protein product [Owenia fusiformis]|uniref:AB hydrolase-1 domain-containing protein n=1 Tax=Owenia fusiformis TaxID=6347 RepID=A0A8S4Q946_OWEFU|nr:unnamed protein product [Owenia fusiformis]
MAFRRLQVSQITKCFTRQCKGVFAPKQSSRVPIVLQHRGIISTADDLLKTRRKTGVLDSSISWIDTDFDNKHGTADRAVVFLHGNPTYSYIWRNIIPHVSPIARCIAPDLIGMGHSDKLPMGAQYRFMDHYRYLSSWMHMAKLPKKITLVTHEWGSALGFDWASKHPKRIEGIVHMESIMKPMQSWEDWPEVGRKIFQMIHSKAGDDIVLNKNLFIEKLLPNNIIRDLTFEELTSYRRPFLKEGEPRRAQLTWIRELPFVEKIKGQHDHGNVDTIQYFMQWLRKTDDIPKLYIAADPGYLTPVMASTAERLPNQKKVTVEGLHYLQEDSPDDIGKAIAEFLVNDVYKD